MSSERTPAAQVRAGPHQESSYYVHVGRAMLDVVYDAVCARTERTWLLFMFIRQTGMSAACADLESSVSHCSLRTRTLRTRTLKLISITAKSERQTTTGVMVMVVVLTASSLLPIAAMVHQIPPSAVSIICYAP